MRKKCSSCGFEFDENVNACPKCGGKVEVISEEKVSNEVNAKKFCLYCGKQIDASAKICPECGANFETGASGKSSNYNANNNMNQFVKTDDSSVTTAFIFSLVGLLCCAVFAIPGLLKANECLSEIEAGRISKDKKSLATAAKIISIISLVLWGISFTVTFLGRLNG